MTSTHRFPLLPLAHPGTTWATRHMPLLARTFDQVGDAFAGLHVGITLHVEPKTAVLCRWLVAAGARVTVTGNLGTTQTDTADALRSIGVTVLGGRSDTADERRGHLRTILDATPDLLLDNGGELIEGVLARGTWPGLRGATEETTTGGLRLRALPTTPGFPVVVINDSRLKLLVENEYGVGQSVVQGFMNATNLMLPGARVGVVGYGPCGRGTADTLRSLNAVVQVADIDPFRALEAVMAGHVVSDLPALLRTCDVVFLATGARSVVGTAEIALLRDGATLVGVGHEGLELDPDALSAATARTVVLSPDGGDADARVVHHLHDGRSVVVLHRTRMINLTAALGNPVQAMDLGLALQARSLAAIATGEASWSGIEPVPAEIDRVLATDLVDLLTRRD
jgi:adenosylhomocysteinase